MSIIIIYSSEKEVETLSETHDLYIRGDSLEILQLIGAVVRVIPFVKVLIFKHLFKKLVCGYLASFCDYDSQ